MKWEQCLLSEALKIVSHGQGKLTLDVGPYAKDQIVILIVAGKAYRFIVTDEED